MLIGKLKMFHSLKHLRMIGWNEIAVTFGCREIGSRQGEWEVLQFYPLWDQVTVKRYWNSDITPRIMLLLLPQIKDARWQFREQLLVLCTSGRILQTRDEPHALTEDTFDDKYSEQKIGTTKFSMRLFMLGPLSTLACWNRTVFRLLFLLEFMIFYEVYLKPTEVSSWIMRLLLSHRIGWDSKVIPSEAYNHLGLENIWNLICLADWYKL